MQEYPQINYAVVLAYMPGKKTEYDDYSDTMLPEGIESVHPHYAIYWRNNWMLKQSDYVVTYITHSYGGAYQYTEKARKLRKIIINLSSVCCTRSYSNSSTIKPILFTAAGYRSMFISSWTSSPM